MYLFGQSATEKPQKIAFLLIPGFTLFCFSSAVEPLRVANRMAGEKLYEWEVYSLSGEFVRAINGMEIKVDKVLTKDDKPPVLIVCASFDVESHYSEHLASLLRNLRSRGTELGAIDTGSYLLAKAGLLDGYKATIHWENFDSFVENFPNVQCVQELYVVDRNRFTTSGATPSLDMILQLIRVQHGLKLSNEVADQFIYHQTRQSDSKQRDHAQNPLIMNNPVLSRTIAAMEENVETPMQIPELAKACNTTVRELERLFRKYLKTSPGAYYRNLRLDIAQRLLRQTDQSILDIAIRCGFNSATSFARSYRNRFGQAPRTSRMVREGA